MDHKKRSGRRDSGRGRGKGTNNVSKNEKGTQGKTGKRGRPRKT